MLGTPNKCPDESGHGRPDGLRYWNNRGAKSARYLRQTV
jgi:hypothetical protein